MNTSTKHTAAQVLEAADYSQLVREINDSLFETTGRSPTAMIRTFGCQQNVSDSEKLKGMLAGMGYTFTDQVDEATLILFNTCAVRENAEDRIFGNVGALKHAKRRFPGLVIGLCGCMMQQEHIAQKIKNSFPYVDLVFGPHALPDLPQLLYRNLSSRKRVFSVEEAEGRVVEGLPVRRDGSVKAFVPIMYGCNNFCTYCVVPMVRGRERSREPDQVLREVAGLVEEGYKDITLLGQNVNSYGKTLANPISFAALLRSIAEEVPGDYRIRFMTSHPKDCTRELVDTIGEHPNLCNHIHLPVQSGSNRILAAMNRHYTVEHYLELIQYAKEKIPGVTFTSDIIVGFPGETRKDFEETLALVRKVEYQSLFTFVYSKRVGTRAAEMEDPIPHEEKMAWFQELLDVQNSVGHGGYQGLVGKTLRVLAEGPGRMGEGFLTGRSESNIIVEFPGALCLTGRFVDVAIQESHNWALSGTII